MWITPACAGKTGFEWPVGGEEGDHPRMRGEDLGRLLVRHQRGGSPPHARGRPGQGACTVLERRITPACAGKTICRTSLRCSSTDHPRMRGEDGRRR